MARKKREEKMQAEVATKPVRLDLPPETHQLLNIVSRFQGKSMASWCRDVIVAAVAEEAKRRGVKL